LRRQDKKEEWDILKPWHDVYMLEKAKSETTERSGGSANQDALPPLRLDARVADREAAPAKPPARTLIYPSAPAAHVQGAAHRADNVSQAKEEKKKAGRKAQGRQHAEEEEEEDDEEHQWNAALMRGRGHLGRGCTSAYGSRNQQGLTRPGRVLHD
jgi:hypothetical protein